MIQLFNPITQKLLISSIEAALQHSGYSDNSIRRVIDAHSVGSGKVMYHVECWDAAEGELIVGKVFVWIENDILKADY